MQLKSKNSKNIIATGLVEVIVVLGILSVTMVSVMGVTIKSMRQVKRDETEDRATGFQLRALELAKSPATLAFPGNPVAGDVKRYSVKTGSTTGQSTIEYVLSNSSIDLTTDNCNKDSEYAVTIQGAGSGEMYCNQIVIEVKTQGSVNYYQIKSVMVYKSLDTFNKKELITFRHKTT
jgi:type II secretory pathway pseudopilin PulG